MKYDDDYSSGHINLFAPQHDSTHKQPKSILKHTNYRTKNPPQSKDDTLNKNFDDLNIRGYASNIYRDDFNALKIESKDNLIPWNGDQNLLIDKYDCRLYLQDLSPYDGELLSESARNPQLSHEENETENLCEFERYLDLNEDDENLNESDQFDSNYHERGAAIGFTYDTNENKAKQINEQEEENKNLKIFVPDENLKLPAGLAYPETVKLNQLIVKTASFVAKQGLQAEILLKTKQSTNSQFNFLNYGDQLHAYYKHLINLIRNNSINPMFYLEQEIENPANSTQEVEKKVSNSENESSENEEDDDEDNYLHPLLSKALNRSVSEASFSQIQDNNLSHLKNEQMNIEEPIIEEKQKQDEKDVKESVETMMVIEEPSGNEKIVIDKLAEYVSRNGVEFEENLRKKNDLRFEFLNKDHKFYNYYQLQVKNMIKKREEENKKEDVEETKDKKESRSKRSHKSSHKKSRKKSTEKSNSSESSRSSSSSSSSSNNEHTDSENEKNNDKKRKVKKKHKHKSHKSRHDKSSSSSRRSHRDSRKKHRKRSRSRS